MRNALQLPTDPIRLFAGLPSPTFERHEKIGK